MYAVISRHTMQLSGSMVHCGGYYVSMQLCLHTLCYSMRVKVKYFCEILFSVQIKKIKMFKRFKRIYFNKNEHEKMHKHNPQNFKSIKC